MWGALVAGYFAVVGVACRGGDELDCNRLPL